MQVTMDTGEADVTVAAGEAAAKVRTRPRGSSSVAWGASGMQRQQTVMAMAVWQEVGALAEAP